MNTKRILSILVIIYLTATILSVISLFYAVNKTTISGKATEGTISIVVNEACENNRCADGENCSDDASACTDNKCYEPTCTNGCGQAAVANGQTDEACTGSTGCTGGNCQCDGSGNCISGPSVGGATGGTSGGGGSSFQEEKETFTVSKERIKISVKINELTKQRLTINNLGKKSSQLTIQIEGLQDILTIKEKSFIIRPSESNTITLEILAKEPGVYTGELIISSRSETKKVQLIIEAETPEVLFDLSIDLEPKTLQPSKELTVHATLFNINYVGLVDVNINYIIKDFNNNIILKESEIINIETQATFSKTFKLPADIKIGDYVLIVQSEYQGTIGTASESFTVSKLEYPTTIQSNNKVLIFLGLLIVLFAAIIVFIYHKKLTLFSKIQKNRLNLEKEKIIDNALKIQKLERQKRTLETAYKQGLISKEAYTKDVTKIENAIRKFK